MRHRLWTTNYLRFPALIEESSGVTSRKTKSWRTHRLRPPGKRNRGGLIACVLQEIEIVEDSSPVSSRKSKSWRTHRLCPPGNRNRGGLVPWVLNEHSIGCDVATSTSRRQILSSQGNVAEN